MARRTVTEQTDISPAEVMAPVNAQIIGALAQTPEGLNILGQKLANDQISNAVDKYKEIVQSYNNEIFPNLVSLVGSLAAQARDAYQQLGVAAQKMNEIKPSFTEQATAFINENKEFLLTLFAPIIQAHAMRMMGTNVNGAQEETTEQK